MKKDKKVTCIIPAYNEEKRILKTLRVVKKNFLIKEIIVIDDCSTDNTLNTIKNFKGIKIINNKKNSGKTFSVMAGLKKSKNNLILMLDADLNNLNDNNLTDIILPVLNKEVDVTIALLKNPFLLRIIGADSACGQRVFNKKIFPIKILEGVRGYGIESVMNEEIIKNNYKIRIINWKNVVSTTKSEKMGQLSSLGGYLSMWGQMIKTVGFFKFILHSFQLAKINNQKA